MLRVSLIVGGLLLSLLTSSRVHVWGDERLLWMEAVRVSPDKPRPWVNLGKQYAIHGELALAVDAFQESIRRAANPARSRDEQVLGRALAEANLAVLRYQQGDRVTALQMVDAIVARHPRLSSVIALQAWMRGGA